MYVQCRILFSAGTERRLVHDGTFRSLTTGLPFAMKKIAVRILASCVAEMKFLTTLFMHEINLKVKGSYL
jgi:hypothetical protein